MGTSICALMKNRVNRQLSTRWYWWHFSQLYLRLERCGTRRMRAAWSSWLKCHSPIRFRDQALSEVCKISFCSEVKAQASIEAALCLPLIMLLFMLLLQPAVLLYMRSMMERAATQTARVIATRGSNTVVNDAALRAYAVRRLSSVPHAAIFHVGADSG